MQNTLLEVKNITKKYEDKVVDYSESFSIYNGDIIGFIGPNGAGKSTSINMLSTLVAPDSGSIIFYGKTISGNNSHYKNALGIAPQDLAISEDLSAYDNVKFFCFLYGICDYYLLLL